MNLHIVPDNTFINKFYDNLHELGLVDKNRLVVRSNSKKLSFVKRDIPFAPLYSSKFSALVGDTLSYENVFIHYFTPLLYRWVARNEFKSLSWMVWGGDLYNLPPLDHMCYEPITKAYVKNDLSLESILYKLKVRILHDPFRNRAYAKVDNILTWMQQEYQFVGENLPVKANQKFFFYENQFPYAELDTLRNKSVKGERLSLIIGNSGSPANNHADVIKFLEENKVDADLLIPVSYGDARYISFLKKNLSYKYGKLEFVDRYMQFGEYLQFLSDADGLVMNTIRPQGYGNILMMFYMNKPVFFNEKNISLPDLKHFGFRWKSIDDLISFSKSDTPDTNSKAVTELLSHERLLAEYRKLFC